jgi:hypothetical protein
VPKLLPPALARPDLSFVQKGTIEMKYTDTQVLNWLLSRVDYLEHRDANGEFAIHQPDGKGFWSPDPNTTEEHFDCHGLDLREYVEAMMKREGHAEGQP